jgi:hypothetical protein
MGRRPEAEQALSGAERQARYRARQASAAPAAVTRQPPAKLRRASRIERWNTAAGELVTLQAEYAGWLDALPQATRDSPTGQVLQAIVELDLDELLAIQPPRGFGRD